MATSVTYAEMFTLIRTKLQRPRLPDDLIPRRRLLDRMHAGLSRKLTLISAQAGAGKTTLLAQWLEECPHPSAWLSLDRYDNDPLVFLSYLIGAVRTVLPGACEETLGLLKAARTPPVRAITTSLVNDLDDVDGLILALDDYHAITEPAVHELLLGLIMHLPQRIHLALASRIEPPLRLTRLRARREMTDLRSIDLRFTLEEAHAFLRAASGGEVSAETTALLEEKTEGWIVGLTLAALTMRTLPDDGEAFVQRFTGASSALIMEYLVSEVLARQPAEIQDFALRTSVLDRFCAPLCAVLTEVSAAKSQEIIEWMAGANLFLIPLDEERKWYRYHHLFQDLLQHKLREQCSAADISGLHTRAGAWFDQNGLTDEALHHFLTADDTAAAMDVVARRRYALMNQAQWSHLARYLDLFSSEVVDQHPELLMAQTWLSYHDGQWTALPAALSRIESALARASLAPRAVDHLLGEISALRSLIAYFAVDATSAMAHARQSLEKVPRDLWIVRIMARLYLAGALQMMGDYNSALAALYGGFEEEQIRDKRFKATLLMVSCNVYWLAGDLHDMAQAADQCIKLSQEPYSPEILGYGHGHLGRVRYHQNDLTAAEKHFAAVVQRPYENYGLCYVYGACGLALTHQALGHPEQAREVAESAVAFMLETANTALLPVALAFEAELALMQGQIAAASQWAARLDPVPPLSPMYGLFAPHLTLVKVWLAQKTPVSRGKAAGLLDELQAFCESTHNTRFLIEVLALQALFYQAQGDEPAALAALKQAITMAEPGGFIRLFVDLGPPIARLLNRLLQQGVAPGYTAQILAAFADLGLVDETVQHLVEPLTPRELEVLTLLGRHLTNKEIAEELVISPSTVKTHTLNIYGKLDAHGRKEAVARARELGILPP